MRPGTRTYRALLALACLMATAGTGCATIILGPISPDAAILQLPQQAATANSIVGIDPTIGMFTFRAATRIGSDAATDLITGTADFDVLSFQAINPTIIVGLSFQFSASLTTNQSVEVRALDRSGRSFLFTLPGPISGVTTVSLLATGGETIEVFSLAAPSLGSTVGPFRVATIASTVPEPSTLALGGTGLVGLALGYARRRTRAA